MRLSATDRIIREAHQHDSAAVEAEDERPDTEKVTSAPLVSLGFPSPRMPTPIGGGVDVSFDDDDDDEEGKTQVDALRSAAALEKMRALQEGNLTPPPMLAGPSGGFRGVPPGRPSATATVSLVSVPAPSAPEAFPQRTLMFGAAVPRSVPATPRPVPSFDQPPREPAADSGQRPSPRRQFEAVPTPSPVVPASIPRRGTVGRRTGFALAAGTAVAVTMLFGSWGAREPAPAVSARPSAEAPVAILAPSGDSPEVPAAGMAPPPVPAAKMESPGPLPGPVVAPVVAPPVDPPSPGPADRSVMPPPPKHAQAATKPARAAKARVAKKKASATKRTARAAGSTHAVAGGGASPGRPAPGAAQSRRRADPDDTLPISE